MVLARPISWAKAEPGPRRPPAAGRPPALLRAPHNPAPPATLQAQAAAGAADAEPAPPPPPAGRHAFLHDFCLCIPYGGLIALCGLVMKLFGGGQTALLIAGAGVAEMALSALSLKAWRARQPVAGLFTVLEAGVRGRRRGSWPVVAARPDRQAFGAWQGGATYLAAASSTRSQKSPEC